MMRRMLAEATLSCFPPVVPMEPSDCKRNVGDVWRQLNANGASTRDKTESAFSKLWSAYLNDAARDRKASPHVQRTRAHAVGLQVSLHGGPLLQCAKSTKRGDHGLRHPTNQHTQFHGVSIEKCLQSMQGDAPSVRRAALQQIQVRCPRCIASAQPCHEEEQPTHLVRFDMDKHAC